MKKGFLRKRGEFLKTYKGFSVNFPLFVVYARANGLEMYRLGVTAPKTVGKAVLRNRLKRWAKEIFRKSDIQDAIGFDIHFFIGQKKGVKKDYTVVQFADFKSQMEAGLAKVAKHFKTRS